jgi:hypothetical protein
MWNWILFQRTCVSAIWSLSGLVFRDDDSCSRLYLKSLGQNWVRVFEKLEWSTACSSSPGTGKICFFSVFFLTTLGRSHAMLWVLGIPSLEVKRRCVHVTACLLLIPRLIMCQATPPLRLTPFWLPQIEICGLLSPGIWRCLSERWAHHGLLERSGLILNGLMSSDY